MVKKIFKFFYQETSALHKAAYLLGMFALLSQLLAFIRDRLLASHFGAGRELDIYYAAFRIPDFIFVTIASIVSLSVLVPFIIEKEKQSKEEVKDFIDQMFSFFFLLIIVACGIAFVLTPYVSNLLFKGFSENEIHRVIVLSRILLLSPIALGFSNLFGSLTQVYNRFFVYAVAPLLYNFGIILGIVALAPTYGVTGVVWGVVLGAVMHMLVQLPFVSKAGLFPKLKLSLDRATIKKVITLSFPRTLTLSTNHIASIFLISLASVMAVGSISVFSFSFNLQSVSLSIIGVSYSLAAFPTLSRYFAEKNISAFVDQMSNTARHIIFWSLPITSTFIVLRAQIVRVLLGGGNFDWNDTRLTAAALALFMVSSVFQNLILLFVRAFYSAGYTRKPFSINLLSALIIVISAYSFVKIFYFSDTFRYFISALLRVEDLPGTVVLMLPLGYSIGTIINGIIHWIGFEKDFPGFSKDVKKTLLQSGAASIIMGTGCYVGLNIFAGIFKIDSLISILLQGTFAGIIGLIAGVATLIALRNREIHEVWGTLHVKFWKTKVIATDPEIA
jgi:putative peptidoglycan lipid II flippase